MKVSDVYSPFIKAIQKTKSLDEAVKTDVHLGEIKKMAIDWEIDLENVERWVLSKPYDKHYEVAQNFIQRVEKVIAKVEDFFGTPLHGEVKLSPSFMRFDGFARYDHGHHTVWFGVDHPDADEEYLSALMAHELSHVYRDHQPDVWGFLNKPLKDVSRNEYLDAMNGYEHLVSEGLATLFSQAVFSDIPMHVHHYYSREEMKWCLQNQEKIQNAIIDCLNTDQDVWKFYKEDIVKEGSPSRTQYFWGAKKINEWLLEKPKKKYETLLVDAHSWHESKFECFRIKDQ